MTTLIIKNQQDINLLYTNMLNNINKYISLNSNIIIPGTITISYSDEVISLINIKLDQAIGFDEIFNLLAIYLNSDEDLDIKVEYNIYRR